MGDSSTEINRPLSDSAAIELTGKIMMVSIIILFLVVVFVIFLHLYAKRFLYIREDEDEEESSVATRRRRFDFAPAAAALRRGLEPSVLKSLPSITFNPKDFKEGLECAVCLSDLADGEKARILPKCNHGFHVDCIDMWFQSHSTCPICRNPVSNQPSTTPELIPEAILGSPRAENSPVREIFLTETPNFPTNVLFWGNETRVSTLGSRLEEDRQAQAPNSSELPSCSSSSSSVMSNDRGDKMLVIDIPNQIDEDEEQKSPVTTRLRSLKRLLSRGRRVSPCSPTVDAEHIARGQS